MKAIVGLGNPGEKYRGTRHNIGFAVLEELARRANVRFDSSPANALVAKVRDPEPGLLIKPLTFMNDSGQAVGELARYFKVDAADLLIVVDEVDLPLAKLRARARGSAGGHNGLKSIIDHLGSEFPAAARRGRTGRSKSGRTGQPRAGKVRQVGSRRSGAHDRARGRRGGSIHHVGDRGGDESVQRRRSSSRSSN